MRLLNRLFAAFLTITTLAIAGCERPAPMPNEENIAVTYMAIDGCWQLNMWQGAPMADDTFLYIEFNRMEHRYTIWDNLNSMYAVDTTGTFTIIEEEDGTYTIMGAYDHGVGDWSNEYRVALLEDGERMQWWSRNGANQVMDFIRVAEIPEFN